jgi:uncharacterized protein (TIGR02246 family)
MLTRLILCFDGTWNSPAEDPTAAASVETNHVRGRRAMKAMLSAFVLGFAVITPAVADDDAAAISKQIGDKWIQASQKRDAAAFTWLFAKDAVMMPANVAQPIVGEANIRAYFDKAVQQPPAQNLAISTSDAKMLEAKTLFAAGTWSGDVPGKDGGPSTHIGGTWLAVDIQEGSDWKIRANTWQTLPPPAAQPATAAAPATNASGTSTPNK